MFHYFSRHRVLGEVTDRGYKTSTSLRERGPHHLGPASSRPAVPDLSTRAAAVPRGRLRRSQQQDISCREEVQQVVWKQLRRMYTGPQTTDDTDNQLEHSERDHETVANESFSSWSE